MGNKGMPPRFATALSSLRDQAAARLDQRLVMADQRPFGEMLGKLRRSALNGERLHLNHAHVLAFVQSPLYEMLAKLESDELAQAWQSNIDSVSSGSHGAATGQSGPYAGTTAPLEPVAESQLASAIATMAKRRPQRNRPLPTISPVTDSRKPSTPTLKQASAAL